MTINKDTLTIPLVHDHSVFTLKKGEPKRVYLLLHGYLLDGDFMLKALEGIIPDNSIVIAPNGPFIVPIKKKDKYIAKYAWYFFDTASKIYYVDFSPSSFFLKDVLGKYNIDKLPVTVIGYSQGGYLSPKLGEVIEDVDTVIGLACCFRNERFTINSKVTYHQIHGKDDIVVDSEGSIKEFEKLKSRGNKGEFTLLGSTAHRIDENMLNALQKYL
jgi:predicted esterase